MLSLISISRISNRAVLRLTQCRHTLSARSFVVLSKNSTAAVTSYARGPKTTPSLSSWPCLYSPHRTVSTQEKGTLVYSGPLSKAVRAIKIFSIATACCSVSFSPIFLYFGNPATPFVGRVVITSLVTTVGLSTTFILHWFIKSYVTKLYFDQATGNVTVETLSVFGRTKVIQFHVSEAKPPDAVSAFSTFQGGGKHFFMHTEIFEDPVLLRQLLGSYSAFEENIK